MRTILVTGAFGFIGSHLAQQLLVHENEETRFVFLDGMTYAARPKYLRDFIQLMGMKHRVTEVIVNIQDQAAVNRVMTQYRPDLVYHLAAESHVCRSITGPKDFIQTNVVGTFNLIEEFYQLHKSDPSKRFIHVSTDEVFGELELHDPSFTETSPIVPRSPYAASKASSDLIALSYFHTYRLPVIVTNCSNNFGPNQHEEKLIPNAILKLLNHKPVTLYGNGKNIRDWLYVEDHCNALRLIASHGKPGERYCIGGETEKTNFEMVCLLREIVQQAVGYYVFLDIEYMNARPTDDKRYAIDCSKIKSLGWEKIGSIEQNLLSTVNYYLRELKRVNEGAR